MNPTWPPIVRRRAQLRGGGSEEEVSPLAARLYHLRKYRAHIQSELEQLQQVQQEEEARHGSFSRRGLRYHIMSRMLILEELEETMRQLERVVTSQHASPK